MDAERPIVVQARQGEGACPYCRETIPAAERALVCEGCGVAYHAACMRQELGRCATLGCAGTRALPRELHGPPAAPARLAPRVKVAPRGAPSGALGRGVMRASAALLLIVGVALVAGGGPSGMLAVVGAGAALVALGVVLLLLSWLLSARVAPSGLACPVCRSSLVRGDRLLVCEGCGDRHHRACLERAGRCPRPGCPGTRARPGRA